MSTGVVSIACAIRILTVASFSLWLKGSVSVVVVRWCCPSVNLRSNEQDTLALSDDIGEVGDFESAELRTHKRKLEGKPRHGIDCIIRGFRKPVGTNAD